MVPDHGWLPCVQDPRRNQYKPLLVCGTQIRIARSMTVVHLLYLSGWICQEENSPSPQIPHLEVSLCFPLGIFFGDILSFVVELLAPGKADLHLDQAAF